MVEYTSMVMNQKGFIRIIEAFIAVLLVAGVLLFVVSKNNDVQGSRDARIEDLQKAVLQEIAREDSFRASILAVENEVEITSTAPVELIPVWDRINERIPINMNLNFRVKVCELDNVCSLDKYPEEDVYTRSIAITANITEYNPKQLKLFVWDK